MDYTEQDNQWSHFNRDTYIEVNLDAIKHNVRQFRRWIGDDVKLLVAVKANAYGHGAVPVARAALEAGADWFAVAFIDEGIELRQAGIDAPILVLGNAPVRSLKLAIQNRIILPIYSEEMVKAMDIAAKELSMKATVHVKVDTGMGRLGVQPEQVVSFLECVKGYSNIEVDGMFTHFATSDEADKSYYEKQVAVFNKVVQQVKDAGYEIPIIHSSNSAAAMEDPSQAFQMVRVGIGLYGLYPSEEVDHTQIQLIPALSLKAKVVHLKELPPGSGVSYGKTYTTQKNEWIATMPVGYADGYSRQLSNRGWVLVNGVRVPVVGRVCMDQIMVNVTEAMPVQVGDEVVVYGKQGLAEVSVDEVASWINTINYEVVCMLDRRIPRVYVSKDEPIEVINTLLK